MIDFADPDHGASQILPDPAYTRFSPCSVQGARGIMTVHAKALHRAAEILGGKEQLRTLNVQLLCADWLRIVAQRGFEQPFLDFFIRVDADEPCACGHIARRAAFWLDGGAL
jgi:hypothetical protein